MFTVYRRQGNSGVWPQQIGPEDGIPDSLLWMDLQSPSPEELARVEAHLNIQIPTGKEVWKNHVLNRFYVEDDIAYMTAALITKADSPWPGAAPVTFILGRDFLLTVHNIAPTSFRNFALRLQRPGEKFPTPAHMLEGLLEEIITRVAYNSEIVVDALDTISHDVFGGEGALESKRTGVLTQTASTALKRLGAAADLNSKINESLHSINRLLVFFKKIVPTGADIDAAIDILIVDTAALTTQSSFLSDKITFQLDATLGMINVEQNLIIKIFSVVAVFFMPPTLVSSLYGMNFRHMPELNWSYGYPVTLLLMLVCALTPYLYFRRKGWL